MLFSFCSKQSARKQEEKNLGVTFPRGIEGHMQKNQQRRLYIFRSHTTNILAGKSTLLEMGHIFYEIINKKEEQHQKTLTHC